MKVDLLKGLPLSLLLLLSLLLSPSSAQLTDAEKKSLLDLHNAGRRNVSPTASNMGLMVWDDTVAASAQAYADKCPSGHSGSSYGENLAWGWPSRTVDSAMNGWYDKEKESYTYSSNSCSNVCGHYTQVVWATSIKLGCGKKQCNSFTSFASSGPGDVYVCQFDPPGNYIGQSPYKSGTACSACPSGYTCSNGLCDSGLVSSIGSGVTPSVSPTDSPSQSPTDSPTSTPSTPTTPTTTSTTTPGSTSGSPTTSSGGTDGTSGGTGGTSGGSSGGKAGLSAGGKAGVAIGVLLGIGVIAVAVFFFVKKRNISLLPVKSTTSLDLPFGNNSNLDTSRPTPARPVVSAPTKPMAAPPAAPIKPVAAAPPAPVKPMAAAPAAPVKPMAAAPAAPIKPNNPPPAIPKPSGAVQRPVPQPVPQPLPKATPTPPPPKPKGAVPLPPGWTEHLDPDTNTPYFYNQGTGESRWVRPGNVN